MLFAERANHDFGIDGHRRVALVVRDIFKYNSKLKLGLYILIFFFWRDIIL